MPSVDEGDHRTGDGGFIHSNGWRGFAEDRALEVTLSGWERQSWCKPGQGGVRGGLRGQSSLPVAQSVWWCCGRPKAGTARFEAFWEAVGLDWFLTYSYPAQPINSFITVLTSDE